MKILIRIFAAFCSLWLLFFFSLIDLERNSINQNVFILAGIAIVLIFVFYLHVLENRRIKDLPRYLENRARRYAAYKLENISPYDTYKVYIDIKTWLIFLASSLMSICLAGSVFWIDLWPFGLMNTLCGFVLGLLVIPRFIYYTFKPILTVTADGVSYGRIKKIPFSEVDGINVRGFLRDERYIPYFNLRLKKHFFRDVSCARLVDFLLAPPTLSYKKAFVAEKLIKMRCGSFFDFDDDKYYKKKFISDRFNEGLNAEANNSISAADKLRLRLQKVLEDK